MYAPQQEIRDYLERCADKYDLRRHVALRRHARVSATWDEEAGLWRCVGEGPDGREELTARFVVSGIGGLHVPAKPAPSRESRASRATSSTPPSGTTTVDLGASGSPSSAPAPARSSSCRRSPREVGQLDLYQRTAPWVLPKLDRHIPRFERTLYRRFPVAPARLPPGHLLVPRARDPPRRTSRSASAGSSSGPASSNLERQVKRPREAREADAELRVRLQAHPDVEHLLPGARPSERGRRHRAASPRVRARSIVDGDGVEREVDVIILGTGFDTQAMAISVAIRGRGRPGARRRVGTRPGSRPTAAR